MGIGVSFFTEGTGFFYYLRLMIKEKHEKRKKEEVYTPKTKSTTFYNYLPFLLICFVGSIIQMFEVSSGDLSICSSCYYYRLSWFFEDFIIGTLVVGIWGLFFSSIIWGFTKNSSFHKILTWTTLISLIISLRGQYIQ